MHRRFKKRMTGIAVAAVCLAALSTDALAMDQAKHDDIKTLLQINGALYNAQTMANTGFAGIIEVIRKANPNLSQPMLDQAAKDGQDELRKAMPELQESFIAIYDSHFTADEIKQLLAFYRSPLGQKLTAQQPQMVQEGIAAGRNWGGVVGQRLVARLRGEGYKL